MLLEAVNVHKSYHQSNRSLHVLKGIGLTIDAGEMISIIGPSGAGKSTLLHILGALDQPDEGTVTLNGEDIYRLRDARRARIRNESIGFVFQFYHLLPEFTALENVVLPSMVKEDQGHIKPFEAKGLELLERIGLKDRASHQPHQLSGGEQQRVAIARALINEPQLIFCDEPTGNLDSESGQGIIELLIDLNKKNKQTLIIVTHDEEVAKISHRSVHMRDGELKN